MATSYPAPATRRYSIFGQSDLAPIFGQSDLAPPAHGPLTIQSTFPRKEVATTRLSLRLHIIDRNSPEKAGASAMAELEDAADAADAADIRQVPRKASREARRVQLIEATIQVVGQRGYSRTTLTDVARTAGQIGRASCRERV